MVRRIVRSAVREHNRVMLVTDVLAGGADERWILQRAVGGPRFTGEGTGNGDALHLPA